MRARLPNFLRLRQRRILVLANGGIGNAIQATPLVLALRSLWPKAFIVFLAPRGDLFEGWGAVDAVVQDVAEVKKLESFDKTFVTFGATLGEPWLTIYANKYFGELLFPQELLTQPFTKPEWECCLDLARRCGFHGSAPPFYVSLRQPTLPLPAGRPVVGFVPGASPASIWRHKRWPAYAELTKLLLARFPRLTLLILGTKDDPIQESLLNSNQAFDLRGNYTLAETAWVLKQADLVIGNDCGPSHIADAVLTEHLVLFGPTCEIKNGPRNRGRTIRVPVTCSPCQYDHKVIDACPKAVCMEQVTPDLVFSRAEEILSRRGF